MQNMQCAMYTRLALVKVISICTRLCCTPPDVYRFLEKIMLCSGADGKWSHYSRELYWRDVEIFCCMKGTAKLNWEINYLYIPFKSSVLWICCTLFICFLCLALLFVRFLSSYNAVLKRNISSNIREIKFTGD